jgi:hypothetical protein
MRRYPHLTEAKVLGVTDCKYDWKQGSTGASKAEVKCVALTAAAQSNRESAARASLSNLLVRKGVEVSPTKLFLEVCHCLAN